MALFCPAEYSVKQKCASCTNRTNDSTCKVNGVEYRLESCMTAAEWGQYWANVIHSPKVKQPDKIWQCSNCYYFQEFGHCSIREQSEVVTAANKCSDWLPLNGVCK